MSNSKMPAIINIWDARPSNCPAGFLGYFGRYGKLRKGQPLALLKEARGGFFMVAPVNKSNQICGNIRVIKRQNLAAIQFDFFMKA